MLSVPPAESYREGALGLDKKFNMFIQSIVIIGQIFQNSKYVFLLRKRSGLGSQGRPKYRWEDNIKKDICQMKIKKTG